MTIEAIVNYACINEQLATAGQPEQDELQSIADAGYHTVINLALHDAEYSLPDEAASIAELGMDYVHIPVAWQSPADADLDAFFQAMQQHRGEKLFIHCAANRRVSVFVALYFMVNRVWSQQQAMDHIHSIWTPDDNWLIFLHRQMERLEL